VILVLGSWRRNKNVINGLFDNGQWCEDMEVVKDTVREFVKDKFDKYELIPMRLDNVRFSSITDDYNSMRV